MSLEKLSGKVFVQNTFQVLFLIPYNLFTSSNIGGAQVQIWSKDHWKLNIVKIYAFKACYVRKKAPSQITVGHDQKAFHKYLV